MEQPLSTYSRLQQLKLKTYCDGKKTEELSKVNQHLQEEKKRTWKQDYVNGVTSKLYLEYLGKDQNEWPNTTKPYADMKKASEEAENAFEKEKDNIFALVQSATQEYEALQEKVKQLEEKRNLFEAKKAQFQSQRGLDPSTADAAICKCEQAISKLGTILEEQESKLTKLDISLTQLKSLTTNETSNTNTSNSLKKMTDTLAFLETQNGFSVTPLDSHTLQLDIKKLNQSTNTDVTQASQDFNLQMTLTFKSEKEGLAISDVKVNLDHFNIDDILDMSVARNNIPYFILCVQRRWNQSFPLLAEIDFLNKKHAIDWIQAQRMLRVLVGKFGKTMFTLSVPSNYPATRGITLVDTYCVEEVDQADLPGEEASLHDWIIYLENKYGSVES